MFIDLNGMEPAQVLQSRICIVGGGVAGLVIAMELERAGIACIVLESGGFASEESTKDLNRGTSSGEIDYHFGDGCRSRFLGGSSNCWGGFCRAFDEADMVARSWVPDSGWPISHSELIPYFKRAHEWLELGPYNYDTDHWVNAINRFDVTRLPWKDSGLTDAISQFSPPVRFGKRYRRHLHVSRLITVVLHANVTRFDSNSDGSAIVAVEATSLNQRKIVVKADQFVLATGGIENSRLLLACSPRHPAGIGNEHDLVGRYFMDHLRLNLGQVRFKREWQANRLYDIKLNYHSRNMAALGTKVAAQIMPTVETQRSMQLMRSVMWLSSAQAEREAEVADAMVRLWKRVLGKYEANYAMSKDISTIMGSPWVATRFAAGRWYPRQFPAPFHTIFCIVEPCPDPDSRITLNHDQKDALGIPRADVQWRIGEEAKRTVDANMELLRQCLEQNGIAEVSGIPVTAGNPWPDTLHAEGTWHHMGGTRMHASPTKGVVDTNSKIHSMANLFVAGSSVFPTAGSNYPTINLTALAIRLSTHLIGNIQSAQCAEAKSA